MSRKTMSRFHFGPVSVSLLALLTAASVQGLAQEQTDPAPASSAEDSAPVAAPAAEVSAKSDSATKPERITVTGSRIRQIELEGPKPIVTITGEEIKKSGSTNVNDYLEKLTIASFGTSSYGSNYGAPAGTQGFDIRGIGQGNTLVLLNGRRLVRDPSLEFVDLSIIPTAAVERIDILKGTASAVYGTDAAAGVVNIITRKDFDGLAFGYSKEKTRYSGGGDKDQAYAVTGTVSEKSSNILVLQWDDQQPSAIGNRPWVDKNFRSIYGAPMSYYGTDGRFHPGVAAGGCQLKPGNQFCGYNYMDEYQWTPSVQTLSIFDDYTYNISKNTKLGARLFATKKSSRSRNLKDVIDESSDGYVVSEAAIQANRPEILNGGFGGAPADLTTTDAKNRPGALVHGRIAGAAATGAQTDQHTYSGTASLSHEFQDGGNLDLSFTESRIERTHLWLNMFDNARLADAVYDGSFDVFQNPQTDDLNPYRLDVPDREQSIARSAEAIFTSEFDFGGRSFGYAVGASQIRESYLSEASQNKLNGVIKGLGGGVGSGERKANAIFGELKAPIVSTLEASVAARYDDYTDFGGTFNPALGLSYRIGKEWFFRANYGTGLKAPTLREVHDPVASYFTTAYDYKKCNVATAANDQAGIITYCNNEASGTIKQGGNSELDPEKSSNYSITVAYEPVEGYGVNLGYYNTKIDDRIGSVSADNLTQLESEGRALPAGTAIERDPITGDITGFVAPTSNLSSLKASGLETEAYAKEAFSFGTLSYKTNYSYVLNYQTQDLPGGPFVKKLEEPGLPRYRWNNTLGYAFGVSEVSFLNRNSGRYAKGNKLKGFVGSYSAWDLNYAVDVSKNATINVGGLNVFNQPYPLDDSSLTFGGSFDFYLEPNYYVKVDYTI